MPIHYRPTVSEAQIAAIHEGLRLLAGADDGAVDRDGVGFNKDDTVRGNRLARRQFGFETLTQVEAREGRSLCWKYRRQLADWLLKDMGL